MKFCHIPNILPEIDTQLVEVNIPGEFVPLSFFCLRKCAASPKKLGNRFPVNYRRLHRHIAAVRKINVENTAGRKLRYL